MMSSTNQNLVLDRVAVGAGAKRSPHLDAREMSERLLRRAYFLHPTDRSLLHGAYKGGLTAIELASLTGVTADTVRSRLRKLRKHLVSDLFTFVLTHRGKWSQERRRVSELRFLQRRSIRDTVRASGVSMHYVRQHSDAILAQYDAIQL